VSDEGKIRDSKLTDRFDWNSRDGVTFDAEQPSVEALVERVRRGMFRRADVSVPDALDALTELAAALERAEREKLEIRGEMRLLERERNNEQGNAARAEARAQKAEAELETVRSERDDELFTEREQVRRAEAVVEAARAYCAVHLDQRPVKSLNEVVALKLALTAYDSEEA
jgi:hypothetical protein